MHAWLSCKQLSVSIISGSILISSGSIFSTMESVGSIRSTIEGLCSVFSAIDKVGGEGGKESLIKIDKTDEIIRPIIRKDKN